MLEEAGLWEAVEPKLIPADNALQALDYLTRSDVDAGFIYATDALRAGESVRPSITVVIPGAIYEGAVPVSAPNPAAGEELLEFLRGEEFRAILARRGFRVG